MTAQSLIDLVHDHDRLRKSVVDLTHERDRLRRENAELTDRLNAINPVLSGNQPGATMAMVLARIVSEVAIRHGTTIQKVRSGGRLRRVVVIKNEAAWECRQVTPRPTLAEIGRAIGLRDHSSVIYAIRQHENLLAASASSSRAPALTEDYASARPGGGSVA